MIVKQNTVEPVFFRFESDFVESHIRCIPMIVRFKLDACGIKLKLAEWSRMTAQEREHLAAAGCETAYEVLQYRDDLSRLILERTGNQPTRIPVAENPAWSRTDEIPHTIQEKLAERGSSLSPKQWERLTRLQRFALLKLSYPGHENKNFPKAMEEFELD